MSTLLQTVGGDISIVNGETTVVTDPVAAGAIELRNKFLLFYGEWFADTRIGVPYYQALFGKVAPAVISRIVRSIIVGTQPFTDADVTVTPPDPGTRKATISFTAYAPNGATVTAASLLTPFIVTIPSGQT